MVCYNLVSKKIDILWTKNINGFSIITISVTVTDCAKLNGAKNGRKFSEKYQH